MSQRPRPLFSSRSDDPGLVDALESFVVGLGERIDALQDTEAGGDLAELAAHARMLEGEARGLGYESFAAVAAAVGMASDRRDSSEARKQLVELTELAQRIRLGHRGAL